LVQETKLLKTRLMLECYYNLPIIKVIKNSDLILLI
jgi:hypothetical protein